jgi:hypothetical protein
MDANTGLVEADRSRGRGSELAERYAAADPFPHIVIDDFLPPQILETCLAAFPSSAGGEVVAYERDQERFKYQFNPDILSPWTRSLFYSFNSQPFIKVLENITGIRGLIPDPFFLGAGFHEITQGGHLSVHADFNHHKPMNLERRINVLIYMNKDWDESYGGQLELWDEKMTRKVRSVTPEFNRCVIFNTTSTSYHGNPEKIRHPNGVSRKSIALYYYTSTWDAGRREHTTQFRVRPGAEDKADWQVKARELVADLTPPLLARGVRGLKSKLGGKAPRPAL